MNIPLLFNQIGTISLLKTDTGYSTSECKWVHPDGTSGISNNYNLAYGALTEYDSIGRIAWQLTENDLQLMGGNDFVQHMHKISSEAGYSSLKNAINDNNWWNLKLYDIANKLQNEQKF